MIRVARVLVTKRNATRKALLVPVVQNAENSADHDILKNLPMEAAGGLPKAGEAKTFFGNIPDYPVVTVVGQCDKDNSESEGRDEPKENLRAAIAVGVKALSGLEIDNVDINAENSCSQSIAEAVAMTTWAYKADKREKFPQHFSHINGDTTAFQNGWILGSSQNLARELMELPSNMLTPKIFADRAKAELEPLGIKVSVYDGDWIKEQKMEAFWSVAKGSAEPPRMVEMVWEGTDANINEKTFCLVGKGVTFDSGGISIKPSASMGDMRADMGGAAVTVGAMKAIAQLKIPGRVVALTPLAENMPSSTASKPGDVVTARNGKTIQIDNTDAEGRLLLCDTLDYASEVHKPDAMIDSATLTGAMVIALGSGTTGVFCKNEELWKLIEKSGSETGDRAWRMPHYQHYFDLISPTHNADLNNTGGREAGSASAAGFLSAFVPESIPWAHFDIAGVMDTKGSDAKYLAKGMTGRPTRTLVNIIQKFHS